MGLHLPPTLIGPIKHTMRSNLIAPRIMPSPQSPSPCNRNYSINKMYKSKRPSLLNVSNAESPNRRILLLASSKSKGGEFSVICIVDWFICCWLKEINGAVGGRKELMEFPSKFNIFSIFKEASGAYGI